MHADHLAALDSRGNAYRRGVPELPFAFERMLDRDTIALGGASWRVIEGHGHSPEHASLHCAERAVLVSGDMLLPRITTNVSVWPAEPDADPLGRFLDSLAAFEALPADTLVLPSHGLPFRGIATARRPAARPPRRAPRRTRRGGGPLAAAAGAPVSAADVVPVLFRRELDLQQRFFAMGEAIAHLNHLWRTRRLDRRAGADGALRFAPA